MALVSVTRLRLRSLRFLPGFVRHTHASNRQACHAPGFLGGVLAYQGVQAFWTVTAWSDEAAMQSFRSGEAHKRAMPKLLAWCDEAAVAHWLQDGPELPDLHTARDRLLAYGRLSRVRHPSPGHAAGRLDGSGGLPRVGLRLAPAA